VEEPMRAAPRALAVALVLFAKAASSQTRPDEDALFGGPPDAGVPPPTSVPKASAEAPPHPASSSRDEDELSSSKEGNAFEAGRVRDKPLQVGGQFYLR